jgi:hypothetical protein
MNHEIDKDLVLSIATSIFENHWDLEIFMEIVCGNEYLHSDTIFFIRTHAELAMKLINATKRKNERKAKEDEQKNTPEQKAQG